MFNAITKQAVTDAMRARQIDARWSTPIWRAARWTIWSAARRRCCGASCRARLGGPRAVGRAAAGLRPRTRDREIRPREYWSLVATLTTPRGDSFEARLVGADGKKIQRLDIGSGAGRRPQEGH